MISRNIGWTLFCLFIFSVFAVGAHKANVFELKLNLLDPSVYNSMYGVSSENIDTFFDASDGTPEITCKVREPLPNNFCALTLRLSANNDFQSLSKGIDLSKYDSLDLDIRYSAPKGSPNIRVTFRNYSPKYVVDDDYISLKYNTFSFEPYFKNVFYGVPLDTLKVEKWWKEKYNISKHLDQIELDNIAYIEIYPNEVQHNKDYSLWVNRLVLRGQLISEVSLFSFILVLWAGVICFLIYRNTQHLNILATSDALTGDSNRRGLLLWATKVQSSFASSQKSMSIVCIDIDDFKKVNDIYGHHLGDALLCALSSQIKKLVQPYVHSQQQFMLCRLAADEFVLAIANLSQQHTFQLSKDLIAITRDAFALNQRLIKITISIGIDCSNTDINKFQYMIDKAGMALSLAKERGKNQWLLFDDSIEEGIENKKKISKKIKQAIDKKQFHLNFMPICCTETLRIAKAEVLIRTNSKEMKGITPDVYIPIAEEYNLIHEIDMMVIEKTLQTISENTQTFARNGTALCINISALELHHNRFVEKLNKLITKYGVDPKLIELEITETTLVDVDARSVKTLTEINKLGVGLALDDFGTGYAAFSQLQNYPVDCLKIDKSFLFDLDFNNEVQIEILKAVLNIADIYKLETVAEGVETREQLAFLRANACQFVQGYLLAKPMGWNEFKKVLEENKPIYSVG